MSLLDAGLADGGSLGIDPSAPRSSALSTKITTILSASYADIEIRDALATLDSRGLRNDAETRRNLRRDVQRELIEANAEIVYDFGLVAEQLRTVGDALKNLQNTCADIKKHVTLARTETKPMLEEASVLVAHKSQVETKQRVLIAFNDHFLLTDDELRVLTSGAEPVDDDFFHILVKAKKIHKDSQTLLSSNNQRLGLEILDQSSKHINAAFQKLYRSIHREFKTLDLENPRINSSVRRALRVLAERPTLFQNCLDTFAESRERTLSDSFYRALTGHGQDSSSTQKPIDFSAHEPLRYVGDMLAWVHSTTVSEREALEALFVSQGNEIAKGIQEGLESEWWTRPGATNESAVDSDSDSGTPPAPKPIQETFDGAKALSQLVNSSLAGVAHLLIQRIDQVVHSHDEPVLAYKIGNLVSFYHNIFTRLVSSSGFLDTLRKIEASALDRFKTTMHFSVSALQGDATSAPPDLSAPDFLATALESVTALLKSYETSLSSNSVLPSPDSTEDGLRVIFSEALDPFLATCGHLASTLPAPSTQIFAINYLQQALSALLTASPSSPTLTRSKVTALNAQIASHSTALTSYMHAFLLSTSGLSPLLSALNSSPSPTAAAHEPAFRPEALAQTSERLDAFLPSAVMDAEAVLSRLRDKEALRDVVRGAAERFVADFDKVEAMVVRIDEVAAENAGGDGEKDGEEEDEEREGLLSVFPRTTEEVRVLLS